MKLTVAARSHYVWASVILFALVAGRLVNSSFDFSYFIVAGSDFVNANSSCSKIFINTGQGYDGQFFYRYALNPFSFDHTYCGVTVDLAEYRMQRLTYPLLTWILSAGGTPALVPFMLVLINILFFAGIILLFTRICNRANADRRLLYLPLLLCGLYMSLARDLSEITELFFYLLALLLLMEAKYFLYAVIASLMILSRETAVLAVIPLSAFYIYQVIHNRKSMVNLVWVGLPFIVLFCFKLYILNGTGSTTFLPGTGNLTTPFSGIYSGIRTNLDFSSSKNILQFLFYSSYLVWQCLVIITVISALAGDKIRKKRNVVLLPLAGIYIIWLLFAVCLSSSVFNDDWAFMRVFSLWNMTGFLMLVFLDRPFPKWLMTASAMLVCLTVIRLIIRP